MKKFGKNDVFYNTLSASPSYKVVFYNGNVIVNDQLSEGNRISSSVTFLEKNFIYTASVSEGFTKNNFLYKEYNISGTLSYAPQFNRSLIYTGSYTSYDYYYTENRSLFKISALRNIFTKYSLDNNNAKISSFFKNDGIPTNNVIYSPTTQYFPTSSPTYFINPQKNINLIEIPQAYYGMKIQPGTLNLKIYVTGTLVAEASDTQKNTKIIQTSSSFNSGLVGTEIGMVLYDEGIILLTGSSQLASISEYYIQPVQSYSSRDAISDSLKWIYFGSHKKITTSASTPDSIVSASYELSFQGATQINTITMFCSAEKNDLTWSNNRTFISGGQGDKLVLGQTSSITVESTTYNATSGNYFIPANGHYFENDQLVIKNTVSSSFSNYSSPYQAQVFISEVGIHDEEGNLIAIAKLANPIKKMADRDYTIKLKLDI